MRCAPPCILRILHGVTLCQIADIQIADIQIASDAYAEHIWYKVEHASFEIVPYVHMAVVESP